MLCLNESATLLAAPKPPTANEEDAEGCPFLVQELRPKALADASADGASLLIGILFALGSG